jgi:LuxR family maltose regulon positive regulatory protein
MAVLSMRGRKDISEYIQAFAGSHRYILDYLGEEVLRQQAQDVQAFLLQTAILDRLSGELCDAVIGNQQSRKPADRQIGKPAASADSGFSDVRISSFAGSQQILEHLERNNLFVVPLDDERRWYRYHHLFADLLQHRLQRERGDLVHELHRRAGQWYERNEMIPEAVSHALLAQDFPWAASLVERTAWGMLTRGEFARLLGWLDALPDSLVRSRPRLGVFRAWSLTLTGQLDRAETHLSDLNVQHVQGQVAAIQSHIAGLRDDGRRAIELAQQAIDHLPRESLFLRGYLALNLGLAYWRSGDFAAGSQVLTEAISLGRAAGSEYLTLVATARLGHVQEMQGLLHQALATHREALQLAAEQGRRLVPYAGVAHVGIAEVLYEWNDLDGARHHATQGVNLCEIGGISSYLLAGRFILAQVSQARGDVDGALAIIQNAERLAQRYDYVYLVAEQAEFRARIWIEQGNVQSASQWVEGHSASFPEEPDLTIAREMELIAVARVLAAQGLSPDPPSHCSAAERTNDKMDQALRLLARLLGAAETARRAGSEIRILVLQALGFQAQGDRVRALVSLERALSLAEPEGFVRTFVDEGEPSARLLRRALSQRIAPNYVTRLLAAFGQEVALASPAPASPARGSLVEPLSDRELEVLRLIAAGLSNPEIAQELVIAVSTVKSHVNHIFGKLGVTSRTQAVARARELNLL